MTNFACLAGESVYRLIEGGHLKATALGNPRTPFGPAHAVYRVEQPVPYLIVPRCGAGGRSLPAGQVNWRANLYALKELGVRSVFSWSAAGAITHNLTIGEVVVPDDLIDLTRQRTATFFDGCDIGLLRQFPVFCPQLRTQVAAAVGQLQWPTHSGGTVAVTEGPRLEAPAEVRMLAAVGAELVCHSLAPEVFLARELQLCFAGACYLVNYAETGSRHRPFSTGELFRGLTSGGEGDRMSQFATALPELLGRLAVAENERKIECGCGAVLAQHMATGRLNADWRRWFTT